MQSSCQILDSVYDTRLDYTRRIKFVQTRKQRRKDAMLYTVQVQLVPIDGLAALALLNPEVGNTLGARVGINPVDDTLRVVAVALNTEVALAVVGEVAVLVDAEAVGAGTLGGSARVRKGQTDRSNLAVDNVQGLEASGGLVLGGEADAGGGVGAADWVLLVNGSCRDVRDMHTDEDLVRGRISADEELL